MRLLVIDEIHLLGDDRGPVLEVIVSRTNFIASHTKQEVRVVGLSTALANASDLAEWLSIKQVGGAGGAELKGQLKLFLEAMVLMSCFPMENDVHMCHLNLR